MKQLFECDPAKNNMCSKERCYTNGGPCMWTTHKEFAKEQQDMCNLDTMLQMQRKFQERLGADFESMSTQDRVAFIKEYSIHLNQEINEMLYELPYFKPWKDYSGLTKADEQMMFEKAKMELIDAWHFFMNMMLGLGMTADEMYTMYIAKNRENHRRQDAGYTADVSYRDQSVEEVMGNE